MRGWGFAALACFGCSFTRLPADPDAPAPPDAAVDAAVEPVCLTLPGYLGRAGSDHRYRAIPDLGDYDAAVGACAAEGAYPVAIDDNLEQEYVRSLAPVDTWIGYDDLTTEGTFRWIDGAGTAFTAFGGGQPDDNPVEDCVELRGDGTWNDQDCGAQRPVVCECDPAFKMPPVPVCRTAAGATTIRGRRYFVRTAATSWSDALADCTSIGATLIAIGDQDENGIADGLSGLPLWIGLSDQQTEGTFQWANAAPAGFTSFATGSPTPPASGGDGLDCVVLGDTNGEWTDAPCSAANIYVCECDPAPP